MKATYFKTVLILASLVFTGTLFAQQGATVKGNITDQGIAQEPLLFANVELKGTDVNVQTNFHGNFELNDVPAGEHTLVISYTGYNTIEVPITIVGNEVYKIEKSMAAVQFSFDEVEGMEELFPADETVFFSEEGKK